MVMLTYQVNAVTQPFSFKMPQPFPTNQNKVTTPKQVEQLFTTPSPQGDGYGKRAVHHAERYMEQLEHSRGKG